MSDAPGRMSTIRPRQRIKRKEMGAVRRDGARMKKGDEGEQQTSTQWRQLRRTASCGFALCCRIPDVLKRRSPLGR